MLSLLIACLSHQKEEYKESEKAPIKGCYKYLHYGQMFYRKTRALQCAASVIKRQCGMRVINHKFSYVKNEHCVAKNQKMVHFMEVLVTYTRMSPSLEKNHRQNKQNYSDNNMFLGRLVY